MSGILISISLIGLGIAIIITNMTIRKMQQTIEILSDENRKTKNTVNGLQKAIEHSESIRATGCGLWYTIEVKEKKIKVNDGEITLQQLANYILLGEEIEYIGKKKIKKEKNRGDKKC